MHAEPRGEFTMGTRHVGTIELPATDKRIEISHRYFLGEAEGDPGSVDVKITVQSGDEPGDQTLVSLDAYDALMLADRIIRAAHLVLEADEEVADPSRELSRLGRAATSFTSRMGVIHDDKDQE